MEARIVRKNVIAVKLPIHMCYQHAKVLRKRWVLGGT